MNFGGAALGTVLSVLHAILSCLWWLVIIAALISWVSPDPRNPIVRFLYVTTEPLFRPFRSLLPPGRTGGMDLSPIFVLLIIYALQTFLSLLFARSVNPI